MPISESTTGGPYQVPNLQHLFKLDSHVVVLQSHEECVEYDAHGDCEVSKWVHDHKLHLLLDGHPEWAALPDQVALGKAVPAWWTLTVGLLQLWEQPRS